MYDNESLDDFYNRFWSFCYRFHLDDFPSTEDLIECFTSLVSSHTENNESINEEQDTSNSLTSLETLNGCMEPELETVIESHHSLEISILIFFLRVQLKQILITHVINQ